MKLRNKKTGEIGELQITEKHYAVANGNGTASCEIAIYSSLAELNSDWEDYEEPEEFYIVEQRGIVGSRFRTGNVYEEKFKQIGNYFETKEEAERTLEKLKAWKRLKDKGFEFEGYDRNYNHWHINFTFDNYCTGEPHSASDDLDLLFGGKE